MFFESFHRNKYSIRQINWQSLQFFECLFEYYYNRYSYYLTWKQKFVIIYWFDQYFQSFQSFYYSYHSFRYNQLNHLCFELFESIIDFNQNTNERLKLIYFFKRIIRIINLNLLFMMNWFYSLESESFFISLLSIPSIKSEIKTLFSSILKDLTRKCQSISSNSSYYLCLFRFYLFDPNQKWIIIAPKIDLQRYHWIDFDNNYYYKYSLNNWLLLLLFLLWIESKLISNNCKLISISFRTLFVWKYFTTLSKLLLIIILILWLNPLKRLSELN